MASGDYKNTPDTSAFDFNQISSFWSGIIDRHPPKASKYGDCINVSHPIQIEIISAKQFYLSNLIN